MKQNKKIALKTILLVLALLLNLEIVHSVPTLPTEFYGNASSFNNPVSSGVYISAYYNNISPCGNFRVSRIGAYGLLTCGGRDTDGSGSGPLEGDVINFRIGTDPASALLPGNNTPVIVHWSTATYQNIILVSPPLVCGDFYCDNFETCNSCSADCGQCTNNQSNQSQNNGSNGGGGGGGGGSGGAGGETPPQPVQPQPAPICEESWSCADWGKCAIDGFETRECVDVNECGTSTNKPETSRTCEYKPPPIKRNATEEKNVTRREPPQREAPLLIVQCTEKMHIFSLPSLLFILLISMVEITSRYRLKKKLKDLEENKKIEEMKKLELKFHEVRQSYTFMIVLFILALVVYLYHYFFFMCSESYIKNLWLLLLFVVVSPVLIHIITEFEKFREKQKLKRSKILSDTHYLHVKKLLEIANQELIRSETAISNSLYSLEKSTQFATMLKEKMPIKNIYGDMVKLFEVYKNGSEAISLEKDLIQNIEKLNQDEDFKQASQKYPELDNLRSSLSLLYKAYQSKQELYNDVAKIEEEYEKEFAKKLEPAKQRKKQPPKLQPLAPQKNQQTAK